MKRISFLPNKCKKKTEHHFYNKDKDKQVHSQIKMHLKNITKIEKIQKNLKYKVSKNEHTTDKDKKTKQSDTLAD